MNKRSLIFLIFFALMLRIAFVILIHKPHDFMASDALNYLRMAGMIWHGKWDEFHFFQPVGYPVIIVFLKMVFGTWSMPLAFLQSCLSVLTLYFIWATAKDTWDAKIAKWSLIIGTFHLPWIMFNGFALSESIFTFFLALILWLGKRIVIHRGLKISYSVLWGIAFYLAFLIKGNHVFLGPFFILAIYYACRKTSFLPTILPISLTVGAGLLLHGLFTLNRINQFQMASSNGGLNFVEGKCPSKVNYDSVGHHWASPLYYQLGMREKKKWDRPFSHSAYFMKEGFKCILNNPIVLIQSLEGIPFLFIGNYLWPMQGLKFAPYMRFYELFFAFFMIPGLLLFTTAMIRHPNLDHILVWGLPILSLFVSVYVFKSEIRFRIPFDVFIIPASVCGWVRTLAPDSLRRQS